MDSERCEHIAPFLSANTPHAIMSISRPKPHLAVLMLLVLAACGDSLVAPAMQGGAPSLSAEAGRHLGQVELTCTVYRRDSNGPQGPRILARQMKLFFPRAEAAADGSTRTYHYRAFGPRQDLIAYANCEIPSTDAALRRADRIFGVQRAHQPPRSSEPSAASTLDCPESKCGLLLEGVTGYACVGGSPYPDCNGVIQPEDYPECTLFGECGSDSPCELPGGGDGWYPPPDDGTGREPCVRDAQGHCVTRELRPTEWDSLGVRIERIREHREECLGAKNALRALYAQGRTSGRFRFWDGYDKMGPYEQRYGQNLSDAQGRYIEYDSHWVWRTATLVAHEGVHAWMAQYPDNSGLVNPPEGTSMEEWVEQMAKQCV